MERDRRFQGIPDEFVLTGNLQGLGDFPTNFQEKIPAFFQFGIQVTGVRFGEKGEMNTGGAILDSGKVLPDFLGREGKDGGHEADDRIQNLEKGGLGRPALRGGGGRGVKAVFQNIQVK
jgi:hypothetical protein